MLVRVVYPVNWISTFRLIPGFDFSDMKSAKIGNVTFTVDEVEEADLAVIVNFSPYHLKMRAREAWIFHHEPGNYKYFGHWLKSYKHVDKVFGSWRCSNEKYKKYESIDGKWKQIEELYKEFDVKDFTVEERLRIIRDFIACMTDKFALNHLRKLNGQKI